MLPTCSAAVRLADRGDVQGPLAEVADGTRLQTYTDLALQELLCIRHP